MSKIQNIIIENIGKGLLCLNVIAEIAWTHNKNDAKSNLWWKIRKTKWGQGMFSPKFYRVLAEKPPL